MPDYDTSKIKDKLKHIYDDLSCNVTYIYERDDLHLAIDLAYHSVLQFHFQDKLLKKGWVEILAVGDTRCGKSETMERLIAHYKAGEISSGENTTFAGLVGGLQQTQKRWSIIWGRIPLNDRKLLCIDEVSGLTHQDIANMSQIRSSGIAEITKIQTERTFARTRLVWLSNPRTDIPVSYFNNGVDIVKDLIGKPEDIARFDMVLIMSSDEVGRDIINKGFERKVESIYTAERCHNLVLWCWSRKANQIKIKPEAAKEMICVAEMLCDKYSTDIPIITMSEQKVKIARLSVALAARLFNTDESFQNIIVEPEHARFIGEFLDRVYSKPSFSYDIWSRNKQAATRLVSEEEVLTRLRPYGAGVINCFLDMKQIRVADIEEILGTSREDAKDLVSFLVKQRAIFKSYTFYQKLPAFIAVLRKLQCQLKDGSVTEGNSYEF